MKWFRSNIKHGVRLALVALAIQFALAFGHFHAAQSAPVQSALSPVLAYDASDLSATNPVDQTVRPQQAPDHDSGQPQGDPCAICAVMALASNVLFATPPLLPLPQAIEFLYRTADAALVHLSPVRVAFQARAPPRLLTSID